MSFVEDQKLLDEIDEKMMNFEFETGVYPSAVSVPLRHYEAVVRQMVQRSDANSTAINIHELNKLEYKGAVLRWSRHVRRPFVE